MFLCERLLENPPYALTQAEKTENLLAQLNELSVYHRIQCSDYDAIWRAFGWPDVPARIVEEVPYLPVSVFKHRMLMSIPEEEIYRTLFSSGTTNVRRSRIILDRATAQRQSMALAQIMRDFLGTKRLPMLIVDRRVSGSDDFSARQAGMVGMSMFGHSHAYALDMPKQELIQWALEHREEPVFVFGFTHMIWQWVQDLESDELSFPNGLLVHGGGWKKLQDQAVNQQRFDEVVTEKLGVKRCHNYYGMVEQVGSIFMGCEYGRLHCPVFAEVIFRDPNSWEACEEGVIQVLSALPTSYPGHSLLTEDLGRMLGVDDCPCGRKGKTFEVLGRVPRAEARGCSNV